MQNLTKWERRFVEMAEHVSTWSKDPNTKIGAVVALPFSRQILSTGYNGLARGVNDNHPERSSRENGEKYFWYGHAERNAIYNAARFGIRLTDSVIHLNAGMPCTGCAIAIIQAGIRGVVCMDGHPTGQKNDKWTAEAERSRVMFKEAGVGLKFY
jgi:dCMP deaminase